MSEQMEVEFELFAARWRYDLSKNENGCYENATTQRIFDSFAWSWKQSRQSLVVKLPVLTVDGVDADDYYKSVLEALDDAGVKYE